MPPRKDSSAAAKKPATRTVKTPAADQVVANSRHIAENTKEIKNNSSMLHILYGVIIILMMIIAGLAFYVGNIMGWNGNVSPTTPTPGVVSSEDIEITIIDDVRCSDCQTSAISDQLKLLPFLSQATFIEKDFSDAGVSEYMKENDLKTIPIIVFSTNALYDGGQIVPYLKTLPNGSFSLTLPEVFDPFATRSENGFLVLDEWTIESLKEGSYIDGNANAKITWVEYSDLECPFCAKLHNEWTPDTIKAKYGDDINMMFQHFPLDFHDEAQVGAEALECIAEQNESALYTLISASFTKYSNNNFTISGFYDLAGENGINKTELESCVSSGKYTDKVKSQMAAWQSIFGVTGTPGNAIINNETGEYEVISGAYPASAFEDIIDRMLK